MKAIADMTVDEIRHLSVYCGPIEDDTPEALRTVLEDSVIEEQVAMFRDWLDAAIYLLGLTCAVFIVLLALYWFGVLSIKYLLLLDIFLLPYA